MKFIVLINFVFLFISSCSKKARRDEAEIIAKAYCDCLERNDFKSDYYSALTRCDAEAVLKSRMYAMYYMRMFYGGPSVAHLPQPTLDSLNAFRDHFVAYLKTAQPLLFEPRPAGGVR